MSLPNQTIQQSELINGLVLNRQTTETVGHLAQFWLDPQIHQVQGLISKSGLLGRDKKYFNWHQVDTLGEDGIFVKGEAQTIDPADLQTVIGNELWTNTGNKVGKIVDYLFNPYTSGIVGYLFASNGSRGVVEGIYLLEPVAISSVGEKRIIVLEGAVESAKLYSEGMQQEFKGARRTLQEDYEQTRKDVSNVMSEAQKRATQLGKIWQEKTAPNDKDKDKNSN